MLDVMAVRAKSDPRIIPSNAARRSRKLVGGLTGAMLVGLVIAAMLGSRAMLAWVQGLPDSPVAEALAPGAIAWDNAMQRIGMVRLDSALRNEMQAFGAWKFPGATAVDQ